MAAFTPSGSGGAPLEITTESIVSYSIVNLSVPTANTEVSTTVPSDVITFTIYNRTDGLTKLAFTATESGTTYSTLPPGAILEFKKASGSSMNLYIQCPKSSQLIELTYGHS